MLPYPFLLIKRMIPGYIKALQNNSSERKTQMIRVLVSPAFKAELEEHLGPCVPASRWLRFLAEKEMQEQKTKEQLIR